jgi:hypothetical protein
MMGSSPKNLDVLLKYMGGINSHLPKHMILFKPRKMDEACVHEQYLENMLEYWLLSLMSTLVMGFGQQD